MNKKIDMPLSEQVAKEASQQINKLDKELNENKDSYIMFLKDVIDDNKENKKFLQKVIRSQYFVIALLIVCITSLGFFFIHSMNKLNRENSQRLVEQARESDERFVNFINEFDFYSEIELLNEDADYNFNNLNVTK